MIDRIPSGFNPFVIPFLFGMAFVLLYCVYGFIRIMFQLSHEDRMKFFLSLINPKTAAKNIRDIFCDCLFHVKLWKRNPLLGYMHSSIAFGWFMLIVLGHIEVILFVPTRINLFYYPIFFNFFVAEVNETMKGSLLFFLMDLFLLIVLSGIALAMIKRVRSRLFGMRRTARPSLTNTIGLYALWAIFPLRLLAETFTAHISGGSFLTGPANWLFRQFLGNDLHYMPTWWAYSICLCVFMCILPFSRYMHIPAEMLLIPMRNAGLKIRNARKGFARVQVYSCPNCGVCIDACPMTVSKENVKDCTVYLTRQIRRGNEKRIAEISDKCLLCGKCEALCQVKVQGPEIRIQQRAIRDYKIKQDYSNITPEHVTGKVLYFSGCMSQLTPTIGRSVVSILKKAGIDHVWMDRDGGLCCGRPMLTAGRTAEAEAIVRKNEELIAASGADTLVVSCPICYRMFNENYNLPGVRVVHYSVLFDELVRKGRLKLTKSDVCYVYHDPCELGRGCGIYDEPRRLIGQSAAIAESLKCREESICCGGSLGSLSLNFRQREKITKAALGNLYTSNADAIATACPLCQATFSRYSDRPVRDIAEIIDQQSL
uniref:Putative Fe-S oxidoreductase n=1 Tax=uncultured bacterium fosmid pJB89E1 TaxID=1478073 RepID=A0A0H3U8D0_9BACT|nr:putative Fe-S oxidoreductase [uncultured bacterium fosmid pJB89E1]